MSRVSVLSITYVLSLVQYNMQICFVEIRSLLFSIVLVLIGTWKWWKMAITLNFCVSSCAVIGHESGNVEW
jgi:hypothetical protein